MNKFISLIAVCLMAAATANAQFTSAPAFPGAEGYGRYVTGGRGGTIIHVTNLNDSGTGSLRAAVTASGKRIVVFDVSGTIYLSSAISIKNPNITILGQTAPGDGVCLANYALNVNADNVIVRYLRCRMGDYDHSDANESDAMSGSHHDNAIKTGIIIDHCSICWSIDECASFYGNKNFTFQWNYVTESMRNCGHSKGNHGYGGIWGGAKASFHHNLLAHHDSRNARIDHDYVSTLHGPIDYVNNTIYNWGSNNTYGGESVKGDYRRINFVGNYFKPGLATKGAKAQLMNVTSYCTNCCSTDGYNVEPAHLYLKGNVITSSDDVTNDNWKGIIPDTKNAIDVTTLKSDSKFTSGEDQFDYNTISIQTAETAFSKVVSYGGCSYARDSYDKRIASEAENGTCTYQGSKSGMWGIIDTPSDVGGYPVLSTHNQLADTDGDGMPDLWENANGLNPDDASDATTYTVDTKGYYTNIEVYANSLVEKDVKAQRADATETFEEYYPECSSINTIVEEEVLASGTITWPMNDASATSADDLKPVISDNLSSYITSATTTLGSCLAPNLTTTDMDGMTALQFKNTSSAAADASDAFTVKCNISPSDDVYLKLTGLEYYAGVNGTNTSCSVSAVYTTSNYSTVVDAANSLPRILSNSVAINSLYHCNKSDISINSQQGDAAVAFSFKAVPTTKSAVLGKVVASVSVTKKSTKTVVDDKTGISSVIAASLSSSAPVKRIKNGRLVIESSKGSFTATGARIK